MLPRTTKVAGLLWLTFLLSCSTLGILAIDPLEGSSPLVGQDKVLEPSAPHEEVADKKPNEKSFGRHLSSSSDSYDDYYRYKRNRRRKRRERQRRRNRRKRQMRRGSRGIQNIDRARVNDILTQIQNSGTDNTDSTDARVSEILDTISFFSAPTRWTGMSSWSPQQQEKRGRMKMMGKKKNMDRMNRMMAQKNNRMKNKMMKPMMMKMDRFRNVMNMMSGAKTMGMKKRRMIMKRKNGKPMQLTWSELRQRKKNMAMRTRRKRNRRERRMKQRRKWKAQQEQVDPQVHVYHLYYDSQDGDYGIDGGSVENYEDAFDSRSAEATNGNDNASSFEDDLGGRRKL